MFLKGLHFFTINLLRLKFIIVYYNIWHLLLLLSTKIYINYIQWVMSILHMCYVVGVDHTVYQFRKKVQFRKVALSLQRWPKWMAFFKFIFMEQLQMKMCLCRHIFQFLLLYQPVRLKFGQNPMQKEILYQIFQKL